MVKIGDFIKITSDNENYDKFREKTWKVSHVARNRNEHPGYDEGIGGTLIDAEGLPLSLYEYEYDIVSKPNRKKGKGWKEAGRMTASGEVKAPEHVIAANKRKASGVSRTPMKKAKKPAFNEGEGTRIHELVDGHFVITNPDWIASFGEKEINVVAYAEILDFNEIDSSAVPIRVGKDVYNNIEEADKELETYDDVEEFPVVVEVSIMVHPKDLSKTAITSALQGSDVNEDIVKNREIGILFDIYSYGGGVPINMEGVSGSHTSKADSIILDAPSRFGGSIKVRHFKNDDDAEDYIRNVYAHNLQAVMTMVGFYLDQPVNLMGTTGWNVLEYQHKGKEKYR